jgi:hypothetical protein
MAHDHHDHGNYYLEQLCTVGICAALGAVTVMLYLQGTLRYMLATKFHVPVLAGGIALLVLVVIRAIALWISVDRSVHVHEHDHDHDHDDVHDHAHVHDHDHGDYHAHDHAVDVGDDGHTHDCAHDHGHEHGWSPWRYAVLLLPVALFFLNLPNQGFSDVKSNVDPTTIDIDDQGKPHEGQLIPLDFKELDQAAYDPSRREFYEGKRGRLKGQFAPSGDPKRFTLVRYKITCCAPDAIALNVMIVSPKPVPVKANKWVEVTGQIVFAKRRDREEYLPVLRLASPADLKEIPPESNPYLQ